MTVEIPITQRVLIYEEYNGPLEVKNVPIPEPKDDELLVKIHYSGICHSDLHGWLGDLKHWTNGKLPVIGGHEGAGEVIKVGKKIVNWKVGDKVGIKLFNDNCLSCEWCKKGFETSCEEKSMYGLMQDGTFQEYLTIRGIDAIKISPKTDLASAAPVLCAGVTAYKALKESNVKAGEIVVINGAGGGLGSFGIQYAKAMGMRVLAVDHPNKEEHCRNLGAEWFVDGFNTKDVVEQIKNLTNGGPHGVVSFAVHSTAMEQAIEYIRPNGTVVLVALPKDSKITVDSAAVVFNQISIKGSLVGSRQDAEEAMDFVSRGIVQVPHKIVSLDQVKDVYKDMHEGKVTSRCVVNLSLQ